MKVEFAKAERGRVVKSNSFETPKGWYRIDIREHDGYLYFFKYRNGELVECMNLNKQGIREVYDNAD